MQRFKITTRDGFYMLEVRGGLAEVLRRMAYSESANPGRHGGPVTVEYVASADASGRFPVAEA